MEMITTTDALEAACTALAQETFVTVDTEFVRDKTYYPKLCLVQLGGTDAVYIVDPLADGIDLAPLIALFDDPQTVKVFHAAKQDVEIFVNMVGKVPSPLYDTQVAAMVCGFGDQVGYETLVSHFTKAKLDKSSRFTDWARRPLTDRQLTYAANDVTHLRFIYEELVKKIAASKRNHWVEEEMASLFDAASYVVEPQNAWRRLKTRTRTPAFLGKLKAL
ncbi:MAG: ribonuclease D, partial [Alphaproteobacteria bacterium]